MEYNKLTKSELIALLEEREELIEKAAFHQKEYEAAKDLREQAIKESYDAKKELSRVEQKLQMTEEKLKASQKEFNNSIQVAKNKYNELAAIFDAYIVAFDDQVLLAKAMVRNNENAISLLKGRILKFNEGEEEQ
jgi:hypothetical protein